MIPYERRKRILEELEKRDIVYVENFTKLLKNVSESTIRRDLKQLSEEGHIVILRGGAAKLKAGSDDVSVNSRSGLYPKEKDRIARCAAELVNDGEVIYIDSGTTTLRMLKYLRNKKITVVTTNTKFVSEIEGTDFNCITTGGEVNKLTASITGPLTDAQLRDMFFDKAFLGASGISLQSGVNTPNIYEANKKRIVKGNSKEVYLLMDSSKINKTTHCKALNIDECIIITDKETDFIKEHTKYILAK